nr:hypothetical protein CFP56_13471 [Quercus suber]
MATFLPLKVGFDARAFWHEHGRREQSSLHYRSRKSVTYGELEAIDRYGIAALWTRYSHLSKLGYQVKSGSRAKRNISGWSGVQIVCRHGPARIPDPT